MINYLEKKFNAKHEKMTASMKAIFFIVSILLAIILSYLSYNSYGGNNPGYVYLIYLFLTIPSTLAAIISSPFHGLPKEVKIPPKEVVSITCSAIYDSLATRIGALFVMYTALTLKNDGSYIIGPQTNARYLIYFALASLTVASLVSSAKLWEAAEVSHRGIIKFLIQINVIVFFLAIVILSFPEASGLLDSLTSQQFTAIIINFITWSVILNVGVEKYKYRNLPEVNHDLPEGADSLSHDSQGNNTPKPKILTDLESGS